LSPDRQTRFRKAYKNALNIDIQGYGAQAKLLDGNVRSFRELTAASWAAATCADASRSPTLRWQALECRCVEERLDMALRALESERKVLQQKLQAAEQAAQQAAIDEAEEEEWDSW
jgi:hypothetical protein